MDLFNQTIAEIKISYSHKVKPSEQVKVTCSNDAYTHVLPLWTDIDYIENFAVLLLSRGNKILGIRNISTGGQSGTVVDVKVILQAALKANASSIICLHNHPSGTLKASEADIRITEKIKKASTLLDISLLDHLIITSESYLSMADEGLM
ncbi:JAB domain-containing protein [Prolixibacteraceae bacterium Z1-6]|uniref:JAB domain-containing protein n=2 Tax=Draconibacterium aestuarii TaxID=2998507 RepID=A0A9X3J586_9BACT|nr:JAB domain-containing protein [Prolixibacteraceae bacterium Z1-6]